ncbi:DegT/DnrJ/EryC1/StrS family aminotransferase [Paenibacillus hodogayensis]|uniref:DegT/DnrJ/EryC1/StrS family aminotransferase n=1 Tax=Paenibacillus hodogayensis TaxID=279208 RepID=A0ABV5W9C5_9BACL
MAVSERKKIYLSSPHLGDVEMKYVQDAFATNWIAPLGPHVEGFEREVERYVGARAAVALSSGTAALHLALRYLNAGPGHTVFCSTLTFVASANPILYVGAKPVFIDSEPDTWNMSPTALERALQEAKSRGNLPKAVIVVHLYGQSADMDPIVELCETYGVPLIEDAAESIGATYKGRSSGTFGHFGLFSFNGNKIITTSGGGMLVSDKVEAIDKIRYWATQARDPARHYQHSEIGYNYRLSNILAAIGRGQLVVLNDRIEARRSIFDSYHQRFGKVPGITFMPELPESRGNRWLTAFTIDPEVAGVTASDLMERLEQDNIEARPIWKPMHLQPLFQGCTYYPHNEVESISDRLFESGICLPSGSNMTDEDLDRVVHVIEKCLKKVTLI